MLRQWTFTVLVVVRLLAAAIACSETDNGYADIAWTVGRIGAFRVAAMWMFPAAGVKRRSGKAGR